MPSVRIKKVHHHGLVAATLLCCFCISLAAFAQDSLPKTKPAGYVNDFAGVLSQSGRDQLTALCTEVDQKAHAQIAIVTVKSLDGQEIEDYAVNLFKKWGIGPKQSDAGILILLAVGDRRNRIEVGYGLEPILPDGKVTSFQREALPYLRDGNYDAALLLMTRRVADVIAQDRGVTLTAKSSIPPARIPPNNRQGRGPSPLAILIFLIFLFILISNLFKRGGGGRGGSGWWIGPMIGGMMGGGGGFGGGGFGGGGGGGGFGGFGGGASGGGGGSVSW